MSVFYTDEHAENASDLYDLRRSWLHQTDIHANAFQSVEDRLCANLKHCARSLHNNELGDAQGKPKKEPKKEAECFVFLASHIISTNPATSNAGYNLAYQWLSLDVSKAAAAETVLSLYPPTDNAPLRKVYEEQETLRPMLLRIFRKQMATLPLAMVNTAAVSEASSTPLKIEALNYAAANPVFGVDLFRTHYLPLLSGKAHFDAAIVEAAIWGGLLRSDEDATRAISAAITQINSAKDRAPLLRLAALSGAAEFLPLLLQAAENEPDTAYYLLGLYGRKTVMPELLKALEMAHTTHAAAAIFTLLTDEILPRIPRLTVVGEEENDGEEAAQIPDIQAARAWWDQNQARWKAEERWLAGKPVTVSHLQALSNKYAGSNGRDVLALLALAQQEPLNIASETWRNRQLQLLAGSADTKPVALPVQKVAQKPENRVSSLFRKKVVASTTTQTNRNATDSVPVAITGLGIACHAGDQPYALITSILGQMSGTQLSDTHKIRLDDGSSAVPRIAPVEVFLDAGDSVRDRLYTLSSIALKTAADKLPANISLEQTLIVIVAPPELLVRYNKIDTQHFQDELLVKSPRLSAAKFRILTNESVSCANILRTSLAELNAGKWQAIIFGGADSLISEFTLMDLLNDNRLNVVGNTEGISRVKQQPLSYCKVLRKLQRTLGYLRGLGVAAEPNARESDLAATEGLSTAINQALTQAGMAASDMQGIVHNLGAETVQVLEWYQTTQTIWPRRVDEQQRMAVQLGEINQPIIPEDPIPQIVLPYMTMGEVGAAALPVHLATALAWMEYDAEHERYGFMPRKNILVCDTPDAAERGALIISSTLATAS